MSDEKRKQVSAQCSAVAHLATALAQVCNDYAVMFAGDAMKGLEDQVGKRTARQMEVLGDILNGMDAVSEDDDWLTPIFEKAHELWPPEAVQ